MCLPTAVSCVIPAGRRYSVLTPTQERIFQQVLTAPHLDADRFLLEYNIEEQHDARILPNTSNLDKNWSGIITTLKAYGHGAKVTSVLHRDGPFTPNTPALKQSRGSAMISLQ